MKIRIATRTSKLAMAQTNMVKDVLLHGLSGCDVEILPYKTSGDRFLDRGLHEFDGKGAFTKEIEDALLRNEADLAVHSLKDLPTAVPDGLVCIAYLKRENPFDTLVSDKWPSFRELPQNARLGTGSIRRIVQIRDARPDIQTVPIRGNVQTRLRKMREQGLDGVILAAAGLIRLGMGQLITQELRPPEFVPAAGQGIIAVEARQDWEGVPQVRAVLDDAQSRTQAAIERGILDALGGGCHAPVGVHAEINGNAVKVWAMAMENGTLRKVAMGFPDPSALAIIKAVVAAIRGQ